MTTDLPVPQEHPHTRLPEHVCTDLYCPRRAPAAYLIEEGAHRAD